MNELIKKYLPSDLYDIAIQYTIPEDFLIKTPDLIEMILKSIAIESKSDKQNRISLMPMMNIDQIGKLRDILEREKDQLGTINKKFDDKQIENKKKFLSKRQDLDHQQTIASIKAKESAHQDESESQAEQLLAGL